MCTRGAVSPEQLIWKVWVAYVDLHFLQKASGWSSCCGAGKHEEQCGLNGFHGHKPAKRLRKLQK